MTNKTNKKNKRPQPTERRVTYTEREYGIISAYDKALNAAIKSIPGVRWDGSAQYWAVPPRPDSLERLVEVCREYQIGADAATAAALAAAVPGATLSPLAALPAASAMNDRLANWPEEPDPSWWDLVENVWQAYPTKPANSEKGSWFESLVLPIASLRLLEAWLRAHAAVRDLWREVVGGWDTTRPVQQQQIRLERLAVQTFQCLGIGISGWRGEMLEVSVVAPGGYTGREGGYSDFRFSVAVNMNKGQKVKDEKMKLRGTDATQGSIALCLQLLLRYAYELGLRDTPWYQA